MGPSLIEIITHAVRDAQGRGLGSKGQMAAAEAVLRSLIPSLSPSIVSLIVEQLYPFVTEAGASAVA